MDRFWTKNKTSYPLKTNGIGIRRGRLTQNNLIKDIAGMNGPIGNKVEWDWSLSCSIDSKRLEQPVYIESEFGVGSTFTIQLFDA